MWGTIFKPVSTKYDFYQTRMLMISLWVAHHLNLTDDVQNDDGDDVYVIWRHHYYYPNRHRRLAAYSFLFENLNWKHFRLGPPSVHILLDLERLDWR